MTDKEFRKLRRSALIEIIFEYQRREQEMQAEIDALKAQLEARELKIAEAGSIADAVIRLNELFETAQKTADDYIAQVKRKCDTICEPPIAAHSLPDADTLPITEGGAS